MTRMPLGPSGACGASWPRTGFWFLDQGITDGRDNRRFALNRSSRDATPLYVIDHTGERKATFHVLDVLHSEPPELKVWTSDVHTLLRDDQERLLARRGVQPGELLRRLRVRAVRQGGRPTADCGGAQVRSDKLAAQFRSTVRACVRVSGCGSPGECGSGGRGSWPTRRRRQPSSRGG